MNKHTSGRRHRHRTQTGGASDFTSALYSGTFPTGAAGLTSFGEPLIENAPMFNPFTLTSVLPTPGVGILPTGPYIITHAPLIQSGGAPERIPISELRKLCIIKGIEIYTKSGNPRSRSTLESMLSKA